MRKIIVYTLLMVFLLSGFLMGEKNNNKQIGPLAKSAMTSDIWMDANRLNGFLRNNGIWFHDVPGSNWGLEWPKGSGLSPMYGAGQWLGARVDGEVRIAGVIHDATEFQPGEIIAPDEPANPNDPDYRWYVLRPSNVGDWSSWPVEQGAPVDEDGKPMMLGDFSAFCVWNDLANHTMFKTNKLNAEIRQYVWAYNRADALGDMMFTKWTIANKSGTDWKDSYFTIWTDPDIGDATDDFVGCDTLLGLGYCYNADNDDQNYGSAPPAAGIDFFQGPIVDEEGAEVVLPDGTVLYDKKKLKMTSFVYYNNNDDPTNGNPDNGQDAYNYMRAIWRDGNKITEGGVGTNPNAEPANFMFSGDPTTGTGWNDSNEDDRRFIMTTGPFDMTYWEANNPNRDLNMNGIPDFGEPGVQVIVAGYIMARGTDNLNSVQKLKEVDRLAQLAYDVNFKLAKNPKSPEIEISAKNQEIILNWTGNSEYNEDGTFYSSTDPIVAKAYGDTVIMDNMEKVILDSTYNFLGYSVYQYSDASGADPVLIDRWEVDDASDASPYTGNRMIRITQNTNGTVGNVGDLLVNGKEYYFGVVAEGYCEYGAPKILESAPTIVRVIPQTRLGIRTYASFGDTIPVFHMRKDTTKPESQGSVTALVVDPLKLSGHDYKVGFYENKETEWYLYDQTVNDTLLSHQRNQRNDAAYNVTDGLMVKVAGAPPSIVELVQVSPDDWNEVIDDNLISSLNTPDHYEAGKPSFIVAADGAAVGDPVTQLTQWDWRGNTTPNDIVIEFVENPETNGQLIFNAWASEAGSANGDWFVNGWKEADTLGGAETIHETNGRLPFRVWKITPSGEKTQVIAGIIDDDSDWYWSQEREGAYVGGALSGWERLYICNYPYDEEELTADGGDNVLNNIFWGSLWDSGHSVGRIVFSMYYDLWSPGSGGIWGKPPAPGTVVRWNSAKPNSENDYYTFEAPKAATDSTKHKKDDIDNIKVVPNPYYGYHSGEMNIFQRWVQFTNLPEKCTIRVFDLAGNQIKKIQKDDPTTTLTQWDLSNEYGLPVASGIYVYHVDIPKVGEKIGKLAIFAPNERLDTY